MKRICFAGVFLAEFSNAIGRVGWFVRHGVRLLLFNNGCACASACV
jgi:hypothetical protein